MPVAHSCAGWVTTDSLDPGENKLHEQIHAVLAAANFDYLQEAALLAHKAQDGSPAGIISCLIDLKSLTYGMNNLVLRVAFSDDTSWIVRIHHVPMDPSYAREHSVDMLSEIATMRTLKVRTTIPVPQVFGFDTSPLNEFGFPYIFMERLNGRHVASQLANVLFQLENLSFDTLGRIWCGENCDEAPRIIPWEGFATSTTPQPQTSLEWFYRFRQDQNRSALETHADDPVWRTACWILKTAVAHIVVEDRLHGPFPLCHFDLHYGNLLFDDYYNLTGVIDWSQTATAPLERLAVSPEFITFPAMSDEENQVIVNFREATRGGLQNLTDKENSSLPTVGRKTTLSMILGSRQAEITNRCTYSRPHRAVSDGRLVSKLIYDSNVSWEQLVAVFGGKELY